MAYGRRPGLKVAGSSNLSSVDIVEWRPTHATIGRLSQEPFLSLLLVINGDLRGH